MAPASAQTALFERALGAVRRHVAPLGLRLRRASGDAGAGWRGGARPALLALHAAALNAAAAGMAAWLAAALAAGESFARLCYFAPCATLCVVCDVNALRLLRRGPAVSELVSSLSAPVAASAALRPADEALLRRRVRAFSAAVAGLDACAALGVAAFALGPLWRPRPALPFLLAYPFDSSDGRLWPLAYVHQIWAAVLSCLTLLTPCYLCYACCTFIIFQFHLLHGDVRRVVPPAAHLATYRPDERSKAAFVALVDRHRKLIRCVDLMKEIYSESNLLNAVTSSILICLTGFNVVAADDLALAVPFLPFLLMALLQIFFICYYGDCIVQSSGAVGDAVYGGQWYRAEHGLARDMMFLALRAQTPCRLTALGFSRIDFNKFAKILGTSWSYFALLKSMYRK